MIRKLVFISFLIISFNELLAQSTAGDLYWIEFTDKKDTEFSTDKPGEFLSQRAIDRRKRQNIEIDQTDLPVSKIYTDSLQSIGFILKHTSKWLNGCTVSGSEDAVNQLQNVSFIKYWELTKPANPSKSGKLKFEQTEEIELAFDSTYYGASFIQIDQLNGLALHKQGFRGKGIQIAVLDNGFLNVNQIAAFDSLWQSGRILGYKDFVNSGGDVFEEGSHGTNVLSAMGACLPNQLIGTAPDASYYLFRTEEDGVEYLVEEDNWVAGAEYADSLGVDIINSSLGYYVFDDPAMNHTYSDMDGKSTRVTRGANMASSKGILVCNSAGNEGNKSWHYIIAPSDGDNILAAGAVNSEKLPASFTSYGPASDGDVKPNVSAMGVATALIGTGGSVVRSNGTSFSSPLLAGMSACLWQAIPGATAVEIKETIEENSSLYNSPDDRLGYGIPDFGEAMFMLMKKNFSAKLENSDWHLYPNPVDDFLQIAWLHEEIFNECRVQIVSLRGNQLFDGIFTNSSRIYLSNLTNLPSGLYLLKLTSEKKTALFKIVKR